jgi:hypothetical protein
MPISYTEAVPLASWKLSKLLDEAEKTGIADGLGGLNPFDLAVEGDPAHAVGLVDGVSEDAVRSETSPALECLTVARP